MEDINDKLNSLKKIALELNDVAEANLATSRMGLEDIEDEDIKGEIKSISKEFEKLKKKNDITGMNQIIVQLTTLMSKVK